MHPAAGPGNDDKNSVTSLFQAARYREAAAAAQALTTRFPEHPFGWLVWGAALKLLGRPADALSPMQKAAVLSPNSAAAQSNLSAVLRDLRRSSEAAASARRALALQPDLVEAFVNLGNALTDLGHLGDAVANYRRALALNPRMVTALIGLGDALTKLGQADEGAAACRRALEIAPDDATAGYNLGVALYRLGRLDEAVASYRRALKINPSHVWGHFNLGVTLQDLGRFDDSVASYRRALEIDPDCFDAFANLLFVRNYQAGQAGASLLAEARRFGQIAAAKARPYTDWPNVVAPDRRLRVGFVSGDFGSHPVGFLLENVLAAMAAKVNTQLDFYAYSSFARAGPVNGRIRACCRGWRSAAGISDEDLARTIRDDGIDILIDLAGHTEHNRVSMFAWKPAPVQVTWLGYLATTGVEAIDYVIGDPWTLPESAAANFTEAIWRLPESYLCFTPPDAAGPPSALPAMTNHSVTFGSFNNLAKINDAVVTVWARILEAVPSSRLFLKTSLLAQAGHLESVRQRFAAQGLDPARLILEGPSPRAELLSAYGRVDIALDPFPYPGITTTLEALWMGVPVLTLAGDRFLSLQGVGIMMNAQLPEWIAADPDDYVARAITHARSVDRLAQLRHGMRERLLASALFDARRFADHFETALRGMWTRWCEGRRHS